MSPQPPQRISWQYVVLAAIGAGFFLGIFVIIPADQPVMRTSLLGLLILAGNAAVTHFLSNRVDRVDHKVNGRMTELQAQLDKANDRIAQHAAQLEARPPAKAIPPAARRPRKKA